MHLTVTTTFCTHCHFVKQARTLRVLEVFVHILCQHTSQLASATLFGACVCLPLFSDGRAAVCAAATWHHRVESFILYGQLILSTTLCPTVYKMVRSPRLCSHLLPYRRLIVLLLQVSCPAHCHHAVQLAHKSLCVPLVMSQVMQCRSLTRSRSSHSLSSYSAATS